MASPPTDSGPFEAGSDHHVRSPEQESRLRYFLGPHAYNAVGGLGRAAAWMLENVVPGTSDAAALRDLVGASREIVPELVKGNYRKGLGSLGESVAYGLSAMPMIPSIIAGRRAIGREHQEAIAEADYMIGKAGFKPDTPIPAGLRDEVYNATQAYPGLDNMMRREMIDRPGAVNINARLPELPEKLGDLPNPKDWNPGSLQHNVLHDDLFRAYPDLGKTEFRWTPDSAGSHNETFGGGRGRISVGFGGTELARTRTLLHELQHGVQGIEGFARGGDPSYVHTIPGAMRHAITAFEPGGMKGEISLADFRSILEKVHKKSPLSEADILKRYEDLMKIHGTPTSGPGKQIRPFTFPERVEGYRRLHGEAEARMVERRFADRTRGRDPENAPYRDYDIQESFLTNNMRGRSAGSVARNPPPPEPKRDWERMAIDRLLRDIRTIPEKPWRYE